MFRNGAWRGFLAGVLCGAILIGVVGAALIWWKPRPALPVRSAEDDALYDTCLIKRGNTVACNAMMRMLDRERSAAETAKKAVIDRWIADPAPLKDKFAIFLAAGFSKREIAEFAYQNGLTSDQIKDALGISQKELSDLLANNTDKPWCDFRPESQRAACMAEPNQK